MKKLRNILKSLAVGLLLLPATSKAIDFTHTDLLNIFSNDIVTAYSAITNNPAPTREDLRSQGLLAKALRDLSRTALSPAAEYDKYVAAATHIGPLAFTPLLGTDITNAFFAFVVEAGYEIYFTSNRVVALGDFTGTKRGAGLNLSQAVGNWQICTNTTDPKIAALLLGQVFKKLIVANRLAALSEAHPGYAPNTLAARTLHHADRGGSGGVVALNANGFDFTETEDGGGLPETGTYAFTRTGLNKGTLVLTKDDGSGTLHVTTVKLTFTSATGGRFTARNTSSHGVENATGTFTLNL